MTLFTTSGLRSSVRFCQILSDTMSPTIRRLDYVLVAPAHRYLGEGYYLVCDPDGEGAAVYSCSGAGTRQQPMIRLHCHNEHYRDHLVSLRHFDEHVLAQVVMTCNVLLPDVLADVSRRHVVEA